MILKNDDIWSLFHHPHIAQHVQQMEVLQLHDFLLITFWPMCLWHSQTQILNSTQLCWKQRLDCEPDEESIKLPQSVTVANESMVERVSVSVWVTWPYKQQSVLKLATVKNGHCQIYWVYKTIYNCCTSKTLASHPI